MEGWNLPPTTVGIERGTITLGIGGLDAASCVVCRADVAIV